MDAGYHPTYCLEKANNNATHMANLPNFEGHPTTDHMSGRPSHLPDPSDSLHLSFDLHHPAPQVSSSDMLIHYAIFDTPVDISLGIPPPRSTSSRALSRGRIPRPRNAFILFRSAFHQKKHLTKAVEKDHRHISRIIAFCWAQLPEAEKDVWRQRAELEKRQHALAYPEYRFKPTPRTKPPAKRNVKRKGPKEIERCNQIAQLLQSGKSGEELTHAVRHMETDQLSMASEEGTAPTGREEKKSGMQKTPDYFYPSMYERAQASHWIYEPLHHATTNEPPPFRSPLLPPSDHYQALSKRPYPATVQWEPANMPLAHPPTITNNPPEPSHNLCFAHPYATQDYTPRELNRSSKFGSHRVQGGQQLAFGRPAKNAIITAADRADPKLGYLESAHYDPVGTRGTVHAAYTTDGQFLPNVVDQWGACYREDMVQGFVESPPPASGVYETWSNSNPNGSASSLQLNSPITAL